jgi:hypothetical protein
MLLTLEIEEQVQNLGSSALYFKRNIPIYAEEVRFPNKSALGLYADTEHTQCSDGPQLWNKCRTSSRTFLATLFHTRLLFITQFPQLKHPVVVCSIHGILYTWNSVPCVLHTTIDVCLTQGCETVRSSIENMYSQQAVSL